MTMADENAEGTVDWKSAADFFEGKERAADDESASDESPADDGSLVDVRIKGRTVKMTKEAANAYSEFVRDARERDGRLGGEIAQLRERSARLEGMIETVREAGKPAQADDLQPPPPKLAIENFEEYHRRMTAYNGALMLRQQAELEEKFNRRLTERDSKQQSDQANAAWANGFFAAHPHLNNPELRDTVASVYRQHAQEIDELNRTSVEDAHERLAELAAKKLASIARAGRESVGETRNRPPRLEGASNARTGKEVESTKQMSAASWSQRKRAELRGDKKRAS